MADSVLELTNVSKIYGNDTPGAIRTHALRDATLTVKRGEFLLVIGSSGSGKSTLLNMIGLLDRPTSGTIKIDGIDTSTLGDSQLSMFRSSRLGFVFQFANLIQELSVIENVELPRNILGGAFDANKARGLLEAVDMSEHMHKRANMISGGQAQRTAIARGLVNDPAIVLADEPTGNLDSKTASIIVDLMKMMATKFNQTFIIVTHDEHQFNDVDRVVTIKDGIIHEGSVA